MKLKKFNIDECQQDIIDLLNSKQIAIENIHKKIYSCNGVHNCKKTKYTDINNISYTEYDCYNCLYCEMIKD